MPTVTPAPTERPTYYPIDDTSIRTAVTAWLADATAAEVTYGHISTWETGGVTDMERLFEGAYDFNEDIGAWDTSAVTDMSEMFNYAWSFNRDLGDWSVAAVTDMSGMFYSASDFNRDLSDWSVAAVTDMSEMFKSNYNFDQYFHWCVDEDVNLDDAFDGTECESTSCGIAKKDKSGECWMPSPRPTAPPTITAAPTLIGYVIDDTTIRTAVETWLSDRTTALGTYGPISTWDTSGVTNMENLFCASCAYGCSCNSAMPSFNDDISAWDTSGVTLMERMFYEASSFNQPIDGWDIGAVTSMSRFMQYARAFDQDLGWCLDDGVDWGSAFHTTFCDPCGVTQGSCPTRRLTAVVAPKTPAQLVVEASGAGFVVAVEMGGGVAYGALQVVYSAPLARYHAWHASTGNYVQGARRRVDPVSYTHLTLPTILLV